jgi:hypothetical protein
MGRLILYLLGILFISLGIFFTIIYLNLFTMGYSFLDFVKFIIREPISWLVLLGILCLFMAFKPKISIPKKRG